MSPASDLLLKIENTCSELKALVNTLEKDIISYLSTCNEFVRKIESDYINAKRYVSITV